MKYYLTEAGIKFLDEGRVKKALTVGALAAGAIAGANDPGVVAKTRMALNPASKTAHVGQPDAVSNYFKNISQASREAAGESSTSKAPKGKLKGEKYLKFAEKHVEPKLRKAYPGHPSWSWNK